MRAKADHGLRHVVFQPSPNSAHFWDNKLFRVYGQEMYSFLWIRNDDN